MPKLSIKELNASKLKEFLLINLGLILVAAGIHFFKIPNHFATGGVSGLAIVTHHYFPKISVGPLMLIINILLLIAGYALIGRNFGSKTVYSSSRFRAWFGCLVKYIHSPNLSRMIPCWNLFWPFFYRRWVRRLLSISTLLRAERISWPRF